MRLLRDDAFGIALIVAAVIVSACGSVGTASTRPTAAPTTSSSSGQPPAESACSDFDSLQRTLRELPVRDLASGPSAALLTGITRAIDEGNALKASAGSAVAGDVAAFVVALEGARLVIEQSSPGPIVSDGVESEAAESLDAVADAWLKVRSAMRAICPAS
jgi:hypothetical protein